MSHVLQCIIWDEIIEAERRMYESMNYTVIDSDNGRCQVMIWINAGILLIGPFVTNDNGIFLKIKIFLWTHLHLKVWSAKLGANLFRPQCDNRVYISHQHCAGLRSMTARWLNVVHIYEQTWGQFHRRTQKPRRTQNHTNEMSALLQ